jgi:hypothetical protein
MNGQGFGRQIRSCNRTLPFLNMEWVSGELVTSTGMLRSISKEKLNIASNELYDLDPAGNKFMVKPGVFKKITFSQLQLK